MLIGELSRRTGVSERLIRYYEDQGLLESRRRANGYREYGDDAELTVARIRALLAAGLPTRSIARLLPCAAGVDALRPCPGTLEVLHERLAELDRRAAEIAEARALLTRTITRTEAVAAPDADTAG